MQTRAVIEREAKKDLSKKRREKKKLTKKSRGNCICWELNPSLGYHLQIGSKTV